MDLTDLRFERGSVDFWILASRLCLEEASGGPLTYYLRDVELKVVLGSSGFSVAESDRKALICLLRLAQGSLGTASALIEEWAYKDEVERGSQPWWLCRQRLLASQFLFEEVIGLDLPPDPHPLLRLELANAALWLSLPSQAEDQLAPLSEMEAIPRLSELRARLLLLKGNNSQSLGVIEGLLESDASSALVWELAVHLLQQQEQGLAAATVLHRALVAYPRSCRLHARQSLRHLLTRRPAIARRHALLQRMYAVNGMVQLDQERSDANLCTCYEHTGRSDLLPRLHPVLRRRFQASPQSLANQALQLAGLADPSYPDSLAYLVSQLPSDQSFAGSRNVAQSMYGRLRVGLISPDFNYHPVGRFVAMMLGQGLGLGGELHLVASGGREDPTTRLIADLADQQGSFHSVKGLPQADQLSKIRDLKLDVAIDLAGWTGENGGVLFASRIAPIQVNYLGYFASTGIPAMDFWLGDAALFPEPMQEWHSEQIWRLPRCFLAWQPSGNLPEGQVEVPAAPAPSVPITFGSFNHARKLSAGTLRLWGELLRTVPGSRLALKSYTTDDPGTVQLLRQRMLRCGLDPERVLWLPTCPTAEEHLRQYGLVDIALDPFPNGGCTTTCEALWMGVPVITLRGDHYVSRMSTAVLQGAGMSEWIAASESEYLALAQRAAAERSNLRQTRANWRLRLQRSPLGDAAGLNQALWQAFAAMPAALKAG